MTHSSEQPNTVARWRLCDTIAAACLFAATTALVLWQNAHLVVLWDLSYVLDSAARIATGQMPYRDFPFAHAPLTFLIQAAIIRLTGRVFFHHVLYCALIGGLGTVLAWRMVLDSLRGRMRSAWAVSVLLAAPLCVLGIYCILPHPSYDCDCIVSILVAVLLLERLEPDCAGDVGLSRVRTLVGPFAVGTSVVVPLFFKQNIGLAFLAAVMAAVLLLLAARLFRSAQESQPGLRNSCLLAVLAGSAAALGATGLLVHFTVGLHNYIYWTIGFAAQRRLPGLQQMIGVYREPALMWMLPCVVAGLALWRSRFVKAGWARVAALGLLAAPFLWTLLTLLVYEDADERGDSLLALWPLLLILSAALTLFNLRRGLSLRALLPGIVLVTINGTLMSQQLWGSTYAIWPLLMLLIAEMIAFLASEEIPEVAREIDEEAAERGLRRASAYERDPAGAEALAHPEVFSARLKPCSNKKQGPERGWLRFVVSPVPKCEGPGAPSLVEEAGFRFHGPTGRLRRRATVKKQGHSAGRYTQAFAGLVAATFVVCGGFYTASEERLSYAQFPEGPVVHATFPQLAGMATPGPYLPEFEELLRYAAANIPASDGLILLPGEDPFYFATGRTPQFPVLLFDPATDPYSPSEVAEQLRAHRIRWLIVKRDLQIKEDPTPQGEAVLKALLEEFAPAARLHGYDVYRRP